MAVAEADPRIARLYETLTEGGRDATMAAFLRALAGGAQDAFGRFVVEPAGAGKVASPGGSPRPSCGGAWWSPARCGGCGDGGPRLFTMSEATFANYVLMRAACDGPGPPAGNPRRPGGGRRPETAAAAVDSE